MKTKSEMSIGLADDATTCAYCGLKVKDHSELEVRHCRAELKSRIAASARAVEQEAVETLARSYAREIDDKPEKKSAADQLNDVLTQISILEDRRKELLFEEAKAEVHRKLAEEEDFFDEVHADCVTDQDLDAAAEEARAEEREVAEEVWDYLEDFGAHSATCLSGALVGEKAPHALCTCGWNEVATTLERR